MKSSIIKIFALFLSSSFTNHAIGDDSLTAQEIMNKVNLNYYYSGDDGRAEARMKIIDSQGRIQIRQFIILRKDKIEGGDQDMLVYFSRPNDIKNTVFRVAKHIEGQDDRWLYLPGLDLIKRISSGDKRTSFVGSDFFYEDISGRNPYLDNHQNLTATEKLYHVKSIAKQTDDVEFSHYETWVDRATFLPTRILFFDKSNKPFREINILKTNKIQGYTVVTAAQVKNITTGHKTVMQIRRIMFDIELPSSIFTEKSLRTPPQKWLKKR